MDFPEHITEVTILVLMIYIPTGDPLYNHGSCRHKIVKSDHIDLVPKQAYFLHLCVTGAIVVKAILLAITRHILGEVHNCKEY